MRTTTRIDDDVFEELKGLAQEEDAPLTRVLNRTLRAGLDVSRAPTRRRRRHREKTFPMGRPLIDLRKALAQAAELEDEETLRKLTLRK
jgi:transcription termination factor Rho